MPKLYHIVNLVSRDNYLQNKDLAVNSFAVVPIREQAESSQVLFGFSRSTGKTLSCGIEVRLWRRAEFCLGQSDFIFADGAWDVCEGDHSLNVMNQWEGLKRKIRTPAA